MAYNSLGYFEFFNFFSQTNYFFRGSILRPTHSNDICTVIVKNIRNMQAVLTNHIADIVHFNDNNI